MTESPPPPLDRLAADWIALWQAELQAMAADPALAAAWALLFQKAPLWAAPSAPAHDTAPRPAPAAAASGAQPDARGGGDDAALRERIAALERRLAALEGQAGGGKPHRPSPRQRRPRA